MKACIALGVRALIFIKWVKILSHRPSGNMPRDVRGLWCPGRRWLIWLIHKSSRRWTSRCRSGNSSWLTLLGPNKDIRVLSKNSKCCSFQVNRVPVTGNASSCGQIWTKIKLSIVSSLILVSIALILNLCPKIFIDILLTVLFTLPMELIRRICLTIRSFLN